MTRFLAAAALALIAGAAAAQDTSLAPSPTWEDLRYDILGDLTIQTGAAPFELEAPYRANDAATVPIVIRQTDTGTRIKSATVVIDENPAPLAAEFSFGPAMDPLELELRVRVDQYSNVRVIADTDQGTFMSGRFVKASGGCSAPASRGPEQVLAGLGTMKLRQFPAVLPDADTARREAQIMLRHPNYSGLQRNQITQLFIPAHFIDSLEVWQGDATLFKMTGGISISENPVFRFSYTDNGAPDFRIRATDTDGNVFEQSLPLDRQS